MNKVHIIGICGRYSAGIAKLLKDQGWQVTGSDQGAYPPLTDYLKTHHIPFHQSYSADHMSKNLDLVIVAGNALHVDPKNPEYFRAKQLNLKITSVAEVLRDSVIKPQSIVVVGTYGKTTITALLVKIFTQAGLNPSYKIGDLSLDFPDFIHTTNSQYSIVEGDEHPTLGYSTKPKFHYYPAKYLLLTSALWDHYNIYLTETEYVNVFKTAVKRLPPDGFLLTSLEGAHTQSLARNASRPVYTYSSTNPKADFFASDIHILNSSTTFTFHHKTRHSESGNHLAKPPLQSKHTSLETASDFPVTLPLFGQPNVENAVAAIALARLLKIDPRSIRQAVKNFRGLPRRLEVKAQAHGITLIHDQGQLPVKIQATLESLRQKYPHRRIIALLDPHASVLHHFASLKFYRHTFDAADQVIIARIFLRKLKKGQSKNLRVTGRRIRNAIKTTQPHVVYLPVDTQILKWIEENAQKGDLLVFFSTGPFRTLIQDTINMLKTTK
jgi:UDP-N-acetylmuramate: L-alanyl-gamma-D-glutamyl-meso-diaminopimelate ligase